MGASCGLSSPTVYAAISASVDCMVVAALLVFRAAKTGDEHAPGFGVVDAVGGAQACRVVVEGAAAEDALADRGDGVATGEALLLGLAQLVLGFEDFGA